jgi:hypothetical protein
LEKSLKLLAYPTTDLKDNDPNLCRNATEYTNNHEYKDAAEVTLHLINIKALKFVYRQNGNELARALVAYL